MKKKHLSRRKLLRGGVGVAAVAALAGCGETQIVEVIVEKVVTKIVEVEPAKPKAVTVTVQSWYNIAFKHAGPRFMAINPHITLDMVDVPHGQHHDKMLAAMVAGSGAPDIAGVEDSRLRLFAKTGGLLNLDPYMKGRKEELVDWKLNLATFEGTQFAMPWDGSPCALFYRPDIFEEYGIDVDSIKLWDDLLAAGDKLSRASDGELKLFNLGKSNYFPVVNTTWQQGAGMYDLKETKVMIDGPEAKRAMTFFKGLWDDGLMHQNLGWDAQNATFKGTSVAFPLAIWMLGYVKTIAPELAARWRVAPPPTWDAGGSTGLIWGGSTLAIPKENKEPEAAFSFLDYYVMTEEGQSAGFSDADLFPVLKDAVNWDIITEPQDYLGGQAAYQIFADVNNAVKPFIYGEGWLESSQIFGKHQTEIYDGNKTVEEGLSDAAEEVRSKQKLG